MEEIRNNPNSPHGSLPIHCSLLGDSNGARRSKTKKHETKLGSELSLAQINLALIMKFTCKNVPK